MNLLLLVIVVVAVAIVLSIAHSHNFMSLRTIVNVINGGSDNDGSASGAENNASSSTTEYIFEPVSKSNITYLKKIEVNADQKEHIANISDSLIQAAFLQNWHGYVLKHNGTIVGFGAFADYDKVPNSIKIYKVMIDKNHQSRGHGKILLEKLLEAIPTDKPIYIDPHSTNIAAISLYKKFNFEIVSTNDVTLMVRR